MQETRGRSLGREDPLEKEMATHSSILAWRITWIEEGGSSWSRKESTTTDRLTQGLRRKEALGKERGKTEGNTLKVECHLKRLYLKVSNLVQ